MSPTATAPLGRAYLTGKGSALHPHQQFTAISNLCEPYRIVRQGLGLWDDVGGVARRSNLLRELRPIVWTSEHLNSGFPRRWKSGAIGRQGRVLGRHVVLDSDPDYSPTQLLPQFFSVPDALSRHLDPPLVSKAALFEDEFSNAPTDRPAGQPCPSGQRPRPSNR